MQRESFLSSLADYESHWQSQYLSSREVVEKFRKLVQERPQCFSRDCFPGHITASALVVDEAHKRILLTHHAKLNKWLQLGGHCDGVAEPHSAAKREIMEESGMTAVSDLAWRESADIAIFDLDIHAIPARKSEPDHFHYDVRYLFVAKRPESIQCSDESHDLKWFSFDEARRLNSEVSLTRLFDKFEQVMVK